MLAIQNTRCMVAIIVVLIVTVSGCGGNSTEKYIPSATVARDALQTALTTWQAGTPHGTIETSRPAINVFDLRWQEGEKLESFEIVENITGREHPTFKVKLKLQNQPEAIDEFLIVGIDPLLVFRDTDYQKATGQ